MAYYSLNNKYGKFRNQEKLLNNCIDSKLQVSMMVDDWIGMATCIIGNNGLVVKLKSYILSRIVYYPYKFSSNHSVK